MNYWISIIRNLAFIFFSTLTNYEENKTITGKTYQPISTLTFSFSLKSSTSTNFTKCIHEHIPINGTLLLLLELVYQTELMLVLVNSQFKGENCCLLFIQTVQTILRP
ncbi:hypothetical protein AAZV13_15G146300 [Glycine max]